jgi:hypothetical protein
MSDPLHKTHNREVQEATERLFTSVIPDFITRSKQSSLNLSALDGNLVKEIHKEGMFFPGCLAPILTVLHRNKRA